MNVQEPLTVFTDYLLAGLAFVFYGRLRKTFLLERQKFVLFWALTFLMITAGAFLGGTVHGFKAYFPEALKGLVWKVTLVSVCLASFFMQCAAVLSFYRGRFRDRLFVLAALLNTAFAAAAVVSGSFLAVIADYLASMGMVLVFFLRELRVPGSGAAWAVSGIAVSFAAAGLQQSSLFLGPLNHNDLYHVVQMGGCYLLYRGVCVRAAYERAAEIRNVHEIRKGA